MASYQAPPPDPRIVLQDLAELVAYSLHAKVVVQIVGREGSSTTTFDHRLQYIIEAEKAALAAGRS